VSPPPGAVVVNYNAGSLLLACIRSLRADGIDDIVIVDNASTDGSADAALAADPAVRVVPTGANLGFGAGVNRGVPLLDGSAVLILNPDVVVAPGLTKTMVADLERDPELGIVGPRTENPDGSLYPSSRTFPALGDAIGHAFLGLVAPRNRFTRRYRMLDWDHARERRVDWVSGACMLIRRDCFDQLGGFDERYFMYLEDVDLCWRAWRAGWAVEYEPDAQIMHVQGASTDLAPYRMIAAHHRSLWRFWWQTAPPSRRVLLAPFVLVGLVARTLMAWFERLLNGRPAN
jgi:N-acetylglucosaminyl-diphospho-decaprenol L-rhamnosyltransferase